MTVFYSKDKSKVKQYKEELTPKQLNFLQYYLDPESETYSNSYKSCKKAGFSESYSLSFTSMRPKWLDEHILDSTFVKKAERNLNSLLDQDKDLRVKADMTKFALTTLAKTKYNPKQEIDITSAGEKITGIQYIVPEEQKTEEISE